MLGNAMATGFGTRLKELRQRASMSQEDVARAAGVSLSAITKIEGNKVEPSWPTVRAIAKALGVSVAEFEVDEPTEPAQPAEPAPKRKKK